MSGPVKYWACATLLISALLVPVAGAQQSPSDTVTPPEKVTSPEQVSGDDRPEQTGQQAATSSSRRDVLIASLTIFVLSIFVGFEIITKVPPTLHTPLMSGSNAISGITLVGAAIVAGKSDLSVASFVGMIAVLLATINVVGGFLVTHRMLAMFKKR